MKTRFFLLLLFFVTVNVGNANAVGEVSNEQYWKDVRKRMPEFSKIFKKHKDFRLEIMVTQIDRNTANGIERLKRYHFGDSLSYFYPASIVKLPASIFLLEKIREQLKNGSVESFVYFDSALFCGNNRYENYYPLYHRVTQKESFRDFAKRMHVPADYVFKLNGHLHPDSLLPLNTSIRLSEWKYQLTLRDLLIAMLVYSDNDAFNKVYEIISQDFLLMRFRELNYKSRIVRRLMYCPPGSDTLAPEYTLTDRDSVTVLVQTRSKSISSRMRFESEPVLVGKRHMEGDRLVKGGKDFANHNWVRLNEMHYLLEKLVLHEHIDQDKRLRIGPFEQRTLLRLLGNHPREITRMRTKSFDGLPDAYLNFLLFGGTEENIPDHLRSINVAGWAFGFTTDCAYIIDTKTKSEIFISARIYTNKDKVIGNDKYEYDKIARPFLKRLGQVILEKEQKREKETLPHLMSVAGLFK